MAKFKGAVLVCQICSTEFKVPSCRAKTATTCSHACSVRYRAQGLTRAFQTYTCLACGRTVATHKSHAEARVYCSKKCQNLHQGGRAKVEGRSRGEKNGVWKGGTTERSDGYIYENAYSHPYATPNGYVFQHRLVAERHLLETNPESPCLVKLGENYYLSPELVVHHKDMDKKNNDISNLQIMTNGDHQRLHVRLRSKK